MTLAQLPSDTVYLVAQRDGVAWLVAAAAASIVLLTLVFFGTALFALVQARRAKKGIEEVKQRISTDPAMEAVRRTAANVAAISDAVRGEVDRLSESVGRLSDRLTQASDRMEERIEDFNALMEVVQAEAESAFVDGASKARGVRAGLGALRARRSERGALERATRRRVADERGRPSRGRGGAGADGRADGGRPADVHPDDALLGDLDFDDAEEPRVPMDPEP